MVGVGAWFRWGGGLPGPEGVDAAEVADGGRGGDVVAGSGEALSGTVPPTIGQVVDTLDVEVGKGLRHELQFRTVHGFLFSETNIT